MRPAHSPLRPAFWALAAALWLSLFLALSDPYTVRQALLTQQQASGRRSTRSSYPIEIAERNDATSWEDGDASKTGTSLLQVEFDDDSRSPGEDFRSYREAITSRESSRQADVITKSSLADTHTVSSEAWDARVSTRGSSRLIDKPAMPILAPSDLSRARPRGEFIELPPPPGAENGFLSSLSNGGDHRSLGRTDWGTAGEDPRLETNLTSLRPEADRLGGNSWSRQLRELQSRQEQLFHLQQTTAERLNELIDEFNRSTARIETLLDQRHTELPANGPSF